MLQRDRQIRIQIQQLADACLFAVSLSIAYALRSNPQIIAWLNLVPASSFESFRWLYVVLIPAAPLILESQGFYDRTAPCPRNVIFWPLLRSCVLITMGLILTLYFFHLTVARGILIWFGFISFGAVGLKEELLRLLFKSKFAQQQFHRRFILAGTETENKKMWRDLDQRADQGIKVVAKVDLNQIGAVELVEMLHDHSANGVILNAKHAYFEQVENIIKACELEGVEVWLLADFFTTQISRTSFDELLGRPLIVFRTAPESSWQGVIKWVMDRVGALILLLLFLPLFLLIAVAIKIASSGPIFFHQQRSGLNGAPFTLYKFRTMITNAEQFKHELEAMNEMSGPVFKVTNDPRVTRTGKFLRRYSLDEFPQLFNVLRGEMSLVGPRPLPVGEVKRFDDLAHRRRLSVKPGLTCLWQISGRNEIRDFKDWVRLDLDYIDQWSLWLDLKILLRTPAAVLRGTGAR
ncbi:MAG: sugar transferase [Verrucomicrobiota bacterium]|jgi:exopolysaccharide biosynthesis polyprenyl glycosylphosphotransferase